MFTNEKEKIKYYYKELHSTWDEVAKYMNADCSVNTYTAESCERIYREALKEE